MELSVLWFVLLTVLFIGFFFLEGFDYGVGILLPFLGKNDTERRIIINTVGPVWDGNEVWMITAGGGDVCRFSACICDLVQRLLPGVVFDADGAYRQGCCI